MKTHVSPDAVAGYIRLSREDTKLPGSLDEKFANRKEIVHRLAAQHGLRLREEDILCERSTGTSLSARPGLLALLERCRKGEISTILTPYQDRLTRGGDHDRGTIKEALCLGNVTLISTEGVMSFDRDFGIRDELLFDLKAAVASHYVRDVIHKRKEADLSRLKKGEGHKTSAPYGFYRVCKADVLAGTYPPDQLGQYHTLPDEYPILLEIFERLQTEKVPALALDLTTRGIPPPSATRAGTTGTRWYAATLYALVRNPFYIGLLAQRSRVERGVGKKRLKPEEYILSDVKGDWETPLSEEQFHTFAAGIQTNRQRAAPRTGLLTGLVQCPQGRPMRLINQSLYGCDCKEQGQGHKGQSVDGGRVEGWLQDAITALVDTLPATAIQSSGKGKRADTGKAKVELAKVRQQIAEKTSQAQDLILREPYFVGLLGRATYEDTARRVRGEILQLQQKADELAVVASRPDLAHVATFVERMKRFDPWEVLERGEKRAAFELFVQGLQLVTPPGRFIREVRIVWHEWTEPYAPQTPPFPQHPGRPQNLYRYKQEERAKKAQDKPDET